MNPLKKYIWIVDTLMRKGEKGLTLEQIADHWDYDDEMHDLGAFSPRSFHRHRNEIKDIFGIEVECYNTGSEYRYRLADTGNNDYFRRWLLDSISLNRIMEAGKDIAEFVGVERTHSDSLPALLQAMKENKMVSFDYHPYWSDHETHYFNFQPYALKMFEKRWYLIGRYDDDNPHRIYALDRMANVETQDETFVRDPQFNLEEMFEGTYGVIIEDKPVESIWLKVDSYQANYLRSLPLHSSQIELRKNEEYTIFALRVRPTFDFKQKLLSLGSTLEVLKPESLRNDMREEAKAMVEKYQEEDG